jgi:CRISPR-associated endonuclease Csn1
MQSQSAPYTLGLDIGIASVGAALLLPEQERILALHVRTFDKAETAKEGESLNKIRRDARSVRRRLRRRAHRLQRLCRLLRRQAVVTSGVPASFLVTSSTAWDLRAEGLDRQLTAHEWATVLYHLAKHRGFQSTRKSEAKSDEKAGEMLSGVRENQERLKSSGLRTVGELAARHPDFVMAKRNKSGSYSNTFDRGDIIHETRLLFSQQRALGNPHAGVDLETSYTELLNARRPALSGAALLSLVGRCTFEPGEYRAPKAGFTSERFVWLGKMNNLKVVSQGRSRPLSAAERSLLVDLPFRRAKLTFKQARAVLELDPSDRFNLLSYRSSAKNSERDPESEVLFEAKSFHALRQAYEAAGLDDLWARDSLDAGRVDALAYALTCFKEDTESRVWLGERGVEDPIVEAVLEKSFDGFLRLSTKAITALLPYLEAGQRYDEAAVSAGYHHSERAQGSKAGRLPAPDREVIRSPVVYRALNQARKLVNAIVDKYGPPAAVHIELARDLSKSFDERRRIEKEQLGYQSQKADAADAFKDLFKQAPRGSDLLKWRLFREQLDQCPYCQRGLDANRLFEPGYSQIDHALPYSRSFDDSQNNKVIAHASCNQEKGNRTPYEALGGASESDRWLAYVAWVSSNKALRQAKRNRLLRVNFGDEDAREFRDRNLSDTRYICREFKRAIESHLQWHASAGDRQDCVVVAGQLTAQLRARWGLLKLREDGDLHHAMDAAVVAATSRSLVQRIARYSKRRELATVRGGYVDPETGEIADIDALRAAEQDFPMPWPHFRAELTGRLSDNPMAQLRDVPGYEPGACDEVSAVRVSRPPSRKGLGQAHQETIRSIREDGLSAVKVPLSALNLSSLERVVGYGRDTALIDALRQRLEAHGGDGKKAFGPGTAPLFKPSRDGRAAPLVRSVRLTEVQRSGLPVRGGIANNGSMLRVDLFFKDGRYFAVPVYVSDMSRSSLPDRAVVAAKAESEWTRIDESFRFLWSLHPGDWVRVTLKAETPEGYFSGLDRGGGTISIRAHDRSVIVGGSGQWRGVGIKTALRVEKFHVDALGGLHLAPHEARSMPRSKSLRA